MGNMSFFENMIERKLLNLHTAYLGKVVSTNGKTAKIQPLGMTKAYGEAAQKQSSLSNVPITKNVTEIAEGDIAVCICCERDITDAKKGRNAVPALGHHSMSDSIIIGVLW